VKSEVKSRIESGTVCTSNCGTTGVTVSIKGYPKSSSSFHDAAAGLIWNSHQAKQTAASDSGAFIVGAFLTIAIFSLVTLAINLLFACWWKSSYKQWYQREQVISETIQPSQGVV
jgi:hypothetical protein